MNNAHAGIDRAHCLALINIDLRERSLERVVKLVRPAEEQTSCLEQRHEAGHVHIAPQGILGLRFQAGFAPLVHDGPRSLGRVSLILGGGRESHCLREWLDELACLHLSCGLTNNPRRLQLLVRRNGTELREASHCREYHAL